MTERRRKYGVHRTGSVEIMAGVEETERVPLFITRKHLERGILSRHCLGQTIKMIGLDSFDRSLSLIGAGST